MKYYRAASDDWKDTKNCDGCVVRNHLTLKALSSCRHPEKVCSCIIWKRQPHSLCNLCSNVYFRNVQHLEFTVNTKFDTRMRLIQVLCIIVNSLVQNFHPSDCGKDMTHSKINCTLIVPGKCHGIVKFLAISYYIQEKFRLYLQN